jgi:integrase
VFTYFGRPIKHARGSLRTACESAKIVYGRFKDGGFVFHDLRRTFTTDMRKAGVQESVIMEITGHARHEVFGRYNQIDLEDKK